MSDNNGGHAPIIIKRKKNVKGGHHGGSWKIAYADFMTALMALFLVLWLLAGSSQSTLNGIAEYFSMPLSVAITGGQQAAMSPTIIPGGGSDPMEIEGKNIKIDDVPIDIRSEVLESLLELIQDIQAAIESDPELEQLSEQISFELMEDGLMIRFMDSDEIAMFDLGSEKLATYMEKILKTTAKLLNEENRMITITGHTDSVQYASGDKSYSNWELSANRANASRRSLVASGLNPSLIKRVIGKADREPIAGLGNLDPANRRIELFIHPELLD